jgi:hypothetical protein
MKLELLVTIVDTKEMRGKKIRVYQSCSKLLWINASNPKISNTAIKTPRSSEFCPSRD